MRRCFGQRDLARERERDERQKARGCGCSVDIKGREGRRVERNPSGCGAINKDLLIETVVLRASDREADKSLAGVCCF